MTNIIGLILARGGSKRIPKKNIKDLAGKPLISWTIETALLSHSFSRLLVSTDSDEIATISRLYGAEVPWLRPQELSHDSSLSIDAILHTISWLSEEKIDVDGVMLLQPTSPFRTIHTIQSCIKLFELNSFRPIVSFDQAPFVPEWCFRNIENQLSPLINWQVSRQRSQDIEPILLLNGLAYLATPHFLFTNRSFLGPSTIPYICAMWMKR